MLTIEKEDFSAIKAYCDCQSHSLSFSAAEIVPLAVPKLRVNTPFARYFKGAIKGVIGATT